MAMITTTTTARRAARRIVALVPGSRPGVAYLVTAGACSCPDYVFRKAATGERCKHMEQTKRGTAALPTIALPCGGEIRPGSVVTLRDLPKFRRVSSGLVVTDVTVSAYTGQITVTLATGNGRRARTVALADIAEVIQS